LKTLNTFEIDALISDSSSLIGAKAQDFVGDQDLMVLKFWGEGLSYLAMQIKGRAPLFCKIEDKSLLKAESLKRPGQKPFFLFYKTHFKGKKLLSIARVQKYGRLVEFRFGDDGEENIELVLEFRLFPGGVNLGLKKGEKSVYLKKPLELAELDDDYKPGQIRSPEVIKDEWLRGQNEEKSSGDSSTKTTAKSKTKDDDKEKDKKEKAKEKVIEALEFLKTNPHKRFAETLQSKNKLTPELKDLYRDNLSERENIEWGFAQQKENELKIKRLEERLGQLAEASHADGASSKSSKNNTGDDLKATRHLQLSQNVRAFCGKTANENLDLLRKSRSWYLWMHLKDYPSGHLILSFPKNHDVSEDELQKSALFLFKVAAPKKLHAAEQVSFEVIFTETKFVKPVKGAKKGLVQPSRIKSRLFVWNKSENLSF